MKIPDPEITIVSLIDQYHASKEEQPRPHMGASMLGHPCDRWLWLSFRWAVQPEFSGRIRRLFRRGHREEEMIIADLKAIGIEVRDLKAQDRVDFGSHVSGSLDAIIDAGVPDAPKKQHIGEFKTHSQKSFDDVVKKGVEQSKPMHYAQMQVYMHGTGIDRALYVAICKNDDSMYTERVRYDKELAERYVARGKRLALEERMPPPLSVDPSWYQCKFCDAYEFCHESKVTKHVNCRTCAHSTPKSTSTWHCARYDADDIAVEYQHQGCDAHVLHPDLVPWEMGDSPYEWSASYMIDGKSVINGQDGFSSIEMLANDKACASDFVASVKELFPGAKVVR